MKKVNFAEYSKRILDLPEKERLEAIMEDIGSNLPIFYGTVSCNDYNEKNKLYVKDIHQINSTIDLEYPYEDAPWQPIRIYIFGNKEVNAQDRVFFSVKYGRLQHPNELLAIRKIKKVSSVLGDTEYKVGNLDLDKLIKIVSAFRKTGIKEIDQIQKRIEDINNEYDNLKTSIDNNDVQIIASLNEKLNKINNIENLQQLVAQSQVIFSTLDRLKTEHLPSNEEIETQTRKWKELEKQARNTEEKIDNLRKGISDLHQEFIDTYPEKEHLIYPSDKREIVFSEMQTIKDRLKYVYPDDKIKMFLTALNTSQIIALCGKPGTGKTTFAEQMAQSLGACFHLIEVQNNWTDRTDLLGFYNPVNNTYHSTSFLEALLAAKEDLNKNGDKAHLHIICLDEMNLSRIEYYFATFLSLLQRTEEQRWISLLPHDADPSIIEGKTGEVLAEQEKLNRYVRFKLPSNVRFVGTMNMDDTAQFLSPKVIDRSIFIEFDGRQVYIENNDFDLSEDLYFPYKEFCIDMASLDEVKKTISLLESICSISPRLQTYIRKMWPIYSALSESASHDMFTDDILLCKVLPSMNRRIKSLNDDNEIPDIFPKSQRRYQEGIERGRALHHFDIDIWSYWE